jgi:hypothetical protein
MKKGLTDFGAPLTSKFTQVSSKTVHHLSFESPSKKGRIAFTALSAVGKIRSIAMFLEVVETGEVPLLSIVSAKDA